MVKAEDAPDAAVLGNCVRSYQPTFSSVSPLRESYLLKQNKFSFEWRHFEPTVILLCVRWYCRYRLSYRDVEEMMRERGRDVDHSTVFRWVQQYAPEINKLIGQHLRMSGTSSYGRRDSLYGRTDKETGNYRFFRIRRDSTIAQVVESVEYFRII